MIKRLCNPLKKQSFFLFGARGTGKSTLLKQLFDPAYAQLVDLLDYETEEIYQKNPGFLIEWSKRIRQSNPHIKWILIDEVQKVPGILNSVHKLIEEKHFLFALTGSSSRKLKRGQANLLAGRALLHTLYPLTHRELGEHSAIPGQTEEPL